MKATSSLVSSAAKAIAVTGPINGSVRLAVNDSSSSDDGDVNAVLSSDKLEIVSPNYVELIVECEDATAHTIFP